jgi:tRNA dimethylallyltransferase
LISKPKIIAVVGPTSSGKSDLAVELARRFNGEIVSADSRQVYKGLNIGSGKITKREMKGVPHYLLDVASPKSTFTVSKYKALAARAIKKIVKRSKVPIICGGTGFYVDALIYNWPIPEVKTNTKLRAKLHLQSAEKLFKTLQKLDPERAKNIDKHNKVRLVRAIEIIKTTGASIPYFKPYESKTSVYEILKIGLRPKDKLLKGKIKTRLLKRIRIGMINEVKNLKENGVSSKKLESFGLEHRYVNRYLEGYLSKDRMVTELTNEIYHYAKRQMTWFKRDKSTIWIDTPRKAFSKVQDFLYL